jgi:hypothetical protein
MLHGGAEPDILTSSRPAVDDLPCCFINHFTTFVHSRHSKSIAVTVSALGTKESWSGAGMDPLAAITMAETAGRFVRWCRLILFDTKATYHSAKGQPVQNVRLAVIASDLEQWSNLIHQELSNPRACPEHEGFDPLLADACRRLMTLADEIRREVAPEAMRQAVRDANPNSKQSTTVQSAKTAFACLMEAVKGDFKAKAHRWADQIEDAHARLSQGLTASLWCVAILTSLSHK